MRKSVGLVLSLLLVLLTAIPAAAASQPLLYGVVTDRTGQPVAGAAVEVYALGQGLVATLQTGSDGSFTLQEVQSRAMLWEVRVWARGYETYESGWLTILQHPRYMSITLQPLAGGLQVTVRDEDGNPVDGTANLIGPAGKLIGQFPVTQGQFTQEALEPGTYQVVVGASGLAPASQTLAVAPGHVTTAAITLQKAGFTVTGEVRDATDSDPVIGAQVELLREDLTQVTRTEADLNGRFVLSAPSELPGTYRVRVSAPGYEPTVTNTFTVSAAGQGVDLSGNSAVLLQARTGSLRVEVRDEDGDPVSGESVALVLQGYGQLAEEKTDSKGTVVFENLEAGTGYQYAAIPEVWGGRYDLQWIQLTPGATKYVVLNAEEEGDPDGEGHISGLVTTRSGEPIQGAKVELVLGDDVVDTVKTNQNGIFRFDDVYATYSTEYTTELVGGASPAAATQTASTAQTWQEVVVPSVEKSAPYTLRVSADGYFTTWDFTINGVPAVQIDVLDDTTTNVQVTLRPQVVDLQGRVVDATDGQPVTGAKVTLRIDEESLTTTADEEGWYNFEDVPVKLGVPYTLQVKADGYLPLAETDVTDAATAGSTLPTASLTPDETIFSGLVLGQDGQPQANVTVTLRGPNGEVLGEATTDATGYYRIAADVPRTGELTLTAAKTGWTTGMVSRAEAPAAGATVSQNIGILPNSGSISGRVRRTDGQVPVFGWVDLLEEGKGVVASVPTDLLGNYRFDNVDLSGTGWFSLRVRVDGTTFKGSLNHGTDMVPLFRLIPGETTKVDLLVEPQR